MADDGAGQSDVWRQRGLDATAALAETWGGLAEACSELSEAEWALPTECPGWDVKDQLSHLIGIERTIMGEPAPQWDGPLGPHVKNDFAASNELWVAVRRTRSGPAVRDEFVEVTRARLVQLSSLDEERWAAVGWSPVGDVPHAVFMEVRVFDSWVHEQDVRQALDRPGGTANRASAMSLARVQGAMPFVVGKKAGCADGTSIRFEISGPGSDGRAFTVAVAGGRGSEVADAGGIPTAALAMSALDFVRLGCGRASGEALASAGAVVVSGDVAVGRCVLDAMNFMF
jgi:uncharacterized protein (TIGR03083 family)